MERACRTQAPVVLMRHIPRGIRAFLIVLLCFRVLSFVFCAVCFVVNCLWVSSLVHEVLALGEFEGASYSIDSDALLVVMCPIGAYIEYVAAV